MNQTRQKIQVVKSRFGSGLHRAGFKLGAARYAILLAAALTGLLRLLILSEALAVVGGQGPGTKDEPKSSKPPAAIRAPKPSPTATPSLAPTPSLPSFQWPSLGDYRFKVVAVDAGGNVIEQRTGQARYFTEDLGDGARLEMVAIPGGSFRMGSPEGEKNRRLNEGPWLAEVKVPAFYMGRLR